MAEVKGLRIAIGASVDDFKSGLADVKSSLGGLGDFASSALGLLSNPIALTVGAIAGIGAAAFKVGTDFQEAFGTIRTGTGATGEALEGLKGSFETVFSTAPGDAQAVASAIADLNTHTGATGPLLEGLATQYLQLANMGGGFNLSIEQGTQAFKAWGIETEAQGGKLDFLFKTSQALGPSIGEITNLVTQNAPALQELGFGFEQSAVLAAKLQEETGNASGVLSSLSRALKEAAEEGIGAREHLDNVVDAIKNAKDPAEAAQVAFDNFGRQGVAMADAIKDGRFEIDDLVKSLEDSTETIGDAEEQSRTFTESWDILLKSVSALLAPLGILMVDALSTVIGWLTDGIQFVKDFAKSNNDTVSPLRTTWESITQVFRQTFEDVKVFLSALVTAWNTDFGGMRTTVETIWGQIKVATEFLFSTLKTIFETAFGILRGALQVFTGLLTGDWDMAWTGIKTIAESILNGIKGAIENIGKLIIGSISNLVGGIQQRWESLKNTLVGNSIVPDMMSDIRDEFSDQSTVDAATGMLGKVEGGFRTFKTNTTGEGGVFSEWADGIKSITGTLGTDMVKGLFTDPGSFGGSITNKLNSIKDSFLDVFSTQIGGILDDFIQQGIDAVTGALDGLISKLTGSGGVQSAFESAFNIGGGGGVPGVPGVPGGGGAGGAAGAATGGLASTLTAIGSIGSLITGIVGIFQTSTTNDRLKLIEENTRFAQIGIIGPSGMIDWLQELNQRGWDLYNNTIFLSGIHDRLNDINGARFGELRGDVHGVWSRLENFNDWGPKFDEIARNTAATERAVRELRGVQTSQGIQIQEIQTAIERNEGGITTTLNQFVRRR